LPALAALCGWIAAVRCVWSQTKSTRGISIELRRLTRNVLRVGALRDVPYCSEEMTHDNQSARIRSDL
jgi:hypothetical protein